MTWFRYAQDYYGGWSPQQVLPPAAMLAIAAVVAFAGIHMLRRARRDPLRACGEEPGHDVERYEANARLYHWGNTILLAGLIVSGVALFVPGSLKPRVLSWLRVHEILGLLFACGVAVHTVVAPLHGDGRSMWFERRDWSDLRTMVSNFFGWTREYPCFGKYDPLQKIYHAFLTLLSAALIVTGVFLILSTETLATFRHESMRWIRLIHDLASVAFAGVIVGHIYFALIPVNWPEFRAMLTGRLNYGSFARKYAVSRWRPKEDDDGG